MEVVLRELTAALLVVALGVALRPMLGADATRGVARLTVDVCMPALVLVQLVETTDRAGLIALAPMIAAGAVALIVPWAAASARGDRVAAFLIGLPNWIYLPLPMAQAMWGAPGTQAVLGFHLGAMLTLWTAGVGLLGGRIGARALATPGFGACVLAAAWILVHPTLPATLHLIGAPLVLALRAVSQLAVPLSLLVTGALLAEGGWPRPDGRWPAVVFWRQLGIPAAVAAAAALVVRLGWVPLGPWIGAVVLILSMPVAISAPAMVRRFVGDDPLPARAVSVGMPLAIVTVPGVWVLFQALVGSAAP